MTPADRQAIEPMSITITVTVYPGEVFKCGNHGGPSISQPPNSCIVLGFTAEAIYNAVSEAMKERSQ